MRSRHVMIGGLAAGVGLLAVGMLGRSGGEPGDGPSAQRETTVESYRGSFRPGSDSGVRGQVVVRRVGDRFHVRVEAQGLPRGEIGQQLHGSPHCHEIGPVELHLDRSLGEAGSRLGGPYSVVSTEGGRLSYDQEAEAPDVRELDLANATVVLRRGSPGLPVAGAELRPTPSSDGRGTLL